jgi:hypothetical protein
MTDDKEKMLLEHWQLLTAGGRLRGEKSRALPAHAYEIQRIRSSFPASASAGRRLKGWRGLNGKGGSDD